MSKKSTLVNTFCFFFSVIICRELTRTINSHSFNVHPLLPDGVPDKKTSRNGTRFLYSTLIYTNF